MKTALFPVIALVMLGGCAGTHGKSWTNANVDADRDYCRTESKGKEPSTLVKALVYGSNIIVVPVTAALTLTLGTVVVYPKTGYAAEQHYYDQCMTNLGYVVR